MRRLMLMLCVACSGTPASEPQPTPEPDPEIELAIPDAIVTADEIAWEQLNPARGDASPMAADLWGGTRKRSGNRLRGSLRGWV